MAEEFNFTTDIVIGLEIHCELATKTKLFCGCARSGKASGDDQPNTRTCPVCLGHPGSKPVLNKKVIDFALKFALAVESDISSKLIFSRKSYFYPDMSKNYQITQYEEPIAQKGKIKLTSGKEVGLIRTHIEEDPAALIHPAGMEKSGYVLVDYNRSGNPLIEVVTMPELISADEARDFMKQLISILNYLKIFDINDGIIKADANISIKESGYTRVEIKNISGFKEIERALNYEIARQKKDVSEGKKIIQETRAWDSDIGITRAMRTKETEEDYGYIIDPDLVMVDITDSHIEKIKSTLPELAHEKTARFIKDYGIDKVDAAVLSAQIEAAILFDKVAKKIDPVLAARWLRRELARVMNYNNLEFADLLIDESHIIDLLSMVEKKEITDNVAKTILEKLMVQEFNVKEYVEKEGLKAVTDTGELKTVCQEIIKKNPQVVEDYKSGNEKSLNFLMGQVMRSTKGKASPSVVQDVLKHLIQ